MQPFAYVPEPPSPPPLPWTGLEFCICPHEGCFTRFASNAQCSVHYEAAVEDVGTHHTHQGRMCSSLHIFSSLVDPMNIRLTGLSPRSLRDSQESSPAPQFESISSLMLSFLYGLTLTSVHDYWKNHNFDYMELCQQSHVSAF